MSVEGDEAGMGLDESAAALLELWLGPEAERDAPTAEIQARWFAKDAAFDAELERKFGELHARASRGALDSWSATPRGRIALVILLDQLSRNLCRSSGRSFANDAKALALAKQGLALGVDRELAGSERYFLYMPFMHSEALDDQRRSVELFTALSREWKVVDARRWAVAHHDIVARFGRFPHRNALLGRDTTKEEEAFLAQPGSSF